MAPIGGVRAGYLSAGKDAIPDSAEHQYRISDDSDKTLDDNFGNIDATVSNISVITANPNAEGGFILDFANNTGEDAQLDSVPSFMQFDATAKYTICFTVNIDQVSTGGDNDEIYHHANGSDVVVVGESKSSDIGVRLVNGNGDASASISDISGFSGLVRFGLRIDMETPNVDFYINANSEDDGTNGVNTFLTDNKPQFNPSIDGTANANIDNPIFYNSLLTESELQVDYDLQQWS